MLNTSGAQIRAEINKGIAPEVKQINSKAHYQQATAVITADSLWQGFRAWINSEILKIADQLIDIPDNDPKSALLKGEGKAFKKLKNRIDYIIATGTLYNEAEKEDGQGGDT